MFRNTLMTAGAIVAASVLSLLAATPAYADNKTIAATGCQPRVPNTAANEIRLTANGISNYSTVNKQVVCPLLKDLGTDWTAENNQLVYYFIAGPTAGRVACTSYVSGPAFGAGYGTTTSSPANVPAGETGSATIVMLDPDDNFGIAPASLICTISPKATLGGFYLYESGDTN